MTSAPAFQLYASDSLATAATFTLEESGAYFTLLAFDWSLNGLPSEPEKIARLLRISRRKFDGIWATIGDQFPERDGRRYNPQLELQRAKQAAWREKSAKGGRANSAKGGSRVVEPPNEPKGSILSPSPSLTPVTDKVKSSTARPAAPPPSDAFERAWAQYPKRGGSNSRGDALKSWNARLATGVAESAMLEGTVRYAKWCAATKKVKTELVMQGKRFYGSSEHFLEPWDIPAPLPAPPNGTNGHRPSKQEAGRAALQEWLATQEQGGAVATIAPPEDSANG